MSIRKIAVILIADEHIGSGHLMRVRNLLPYLHNCEFTLITESLGERFVPLCQDYKEIVRVKSDEETLKALKTLKPSLVLIDNYSVDISLERRVHELCPIAVIDDLANRRHQADILFDHGLLRKAQDYQGLVPDNCRLCIGAEYALVREAFAAIPQHKAADEPLVLINFGGADPVGACMLTAESVLKARLNEKYRFLILSGISNPQHEALEAKFSGIHNFTVQRYCDDMPGLFSKCDLSFGAYGGSFGERLCAGLPSINTVIADNQEGAPEILKRYEVGLDLPLEGLSDPDKVAGALNILAAKREIFVRNGRTLIDGRGYVRVSEALLECLKG